MAEFVHTLWFECSRCGSAIAATITTDHGNLEEIDCRKIPLLCDCGWAARRLGFTASRHFSRLADTSSRTTPRKDRYFVKVYEGPRSTGLDRFITF
jgi:hypothetical protein